MDKFYLIDYQPIEAFCSNPPLTATKRPHRRRGLFFCAEFKPILHLCPMSRTLAFCFFCLAAISSQGQITAITYNIRYNTPRDSANAWPQRLPAFKQQLKQFDFLGVQEGLHGQLLDLQESLGNTYRWVGLGRDFGDQRGEHCAIFYNQQKFTLVNDTSYTEWLSNTPKKPSKDWDAALPRIVTFAKFQEKSSGKFLWIFNTHFDHIGNTARYQSALILKALVEKLTKTDPVIIMGDFNCQDTSKPIRYLLDHFTNTAYSATRVQMNINPSAPNKGTFNGFAKNAEQAGPTIDYIFVKNLNVDTYWVDYTTRGPGLYISDHYPVMTYLVFQ